jgi:hypothetical protein
MYNIKNFIGHDLAIIVVRNLLLIGLYGIDTDVIHLLVLFEHQCHVHCLDMNVICLFVLFRHKCCVYIHIFYTWKSCTRLSCLNNAWHLCVNDMNPWNNRFCMDLEWTHEAYKFVMNSTTWTFERKEFCMWVVLEDIIIILLNIPCNTWPIGHDFFMVNSLVKRCSYSININEFIIVM